MKIGVGATKALSLLVVWCMVCTAFAGMLVLMVPGAGQALSPSEVDGDKYIGQDFTESIWDVGGTVNLNGDLVIRAGGVVNVTNGLLKFRSYDGHINQLIIEDGGRLNLVNSAVEAEYALYNVSYSLGVLVRNGGVLYAEDSRLDFKGKVLVDDAALIAHRTTISGPLFTAMSSQVELYDSELIETPGFPMLEELTYSYPFASAANQSVGVTYLFERNPSASLTHDVTLVQMNDSGNVTLAQDEGLETTGFDIGGLVFDAGEAVSMTLKAEYKTADDYVAGTDAFNYNLYMGTPVVTGMVIVETYEAYNPAATNKEMVLSEDISDLDLSSVDLSMLSVSLNNTQPGSVMIDRIWVEVELAIPAYHNITIAGMSELTAVNSEFGANYLGYSDYNFRKLVVSDAAQANLYGVEVDGAFFQGGMGPFVTVERNVSFRPSLVDNATTGVLEILLDDGYALGQFLQIAGGGTYKNITGFLTGGLSGDIASVELLVKWRTDAGFGISQPVLYNLPGQPNMSSGVQIVQTGVDEATQSGLLEDYAPSTISDIAQLVVHFTNTNAIGTDAQVGYVVLNATISPSINICRWADVKVVDSNNLPVAGAQVNATLSPSGTPAYYLYNDTINPVPPQGVMDYLGRNATSIGVTNDSGMVLLPLLTDIMNPEWAPNSYAIENYKIGVDYVNTTGYHFIPAPGNSTFEGYPQLGVQVISLEFILDELMLELPDVKAMNLTTDPLTVYQGDMVTMNFQVTNLGLTTASKFAVTIVDSIGNVTNDLGIINVTNLLPGEVRDLSTVWISNYTTPGTHSIVISVDPDDEVMELDESNVLTVPVLVLAFLPDLSVDEAGIVFSPNLGLAKQPMYINATISNEGGRLVAMNATVRFYIGDPTAGGTLQGTTNVEVASGGTAVASFEWIPIQIGSYPIYVTVNEPVNDVRPIVEYSYDNNMASRMLEVILEAGTNDWLITTEWPSIIGASFDWYYNIIVEGEGSLSMTDTQLFMGQTSVSKPTQIIVRDNGTLMLDNSRVDSNLVLRIYLFDNATLFLSGSVLTTNVVLILDENSNALVDESNVMGDLQAPSSSSAKLTAVNTTFGRAWSYFGGTATAELTGASINGVPAVSPKDGAVITLYSWIVVSVYDGTGMHKIPGAYVEAKSFVNQMVYGTGATNESGDWTFRALSDVVSVSGPGAVVCGYYQVNATHWFDGERYDSDVAQVAEISYNPDIVLARQDALVRLDISSALPNLDPPLLVSNDTPLRGSTVNLTTEVNNIGVVTAYNVLVRFEDNSSAGKVIISDHIIEELPAQSSVQVTVTWVATYPLGWHNLSVMIDPLEAIPELNESNNFNYTLVNVMGVADLVVTSSNIVFNPTVPIRDRASAITVSVRNIGDEAISAFNVSFYEENTLINISRIGNLPTGATTSVTVSWEPSQAGLRNVTVRLDPENVVPESDETNNLATRTIIVFDYPDLVASSISFLVDGKPANKASVNQLVTIRAEIFNTGQSSADQFDVVFWLNEETVIGMVRVTTLPSGASAVVSTTWQATLITGMGLYQDNNITVVVNPASNGTVTHISEVDDPLNANNWASQEIQVIDDRPDMAVYNEKVQYSNQNITSGTIGQKVFVLFDVENVGIPDGTGITVSVSLVNETIDMLLFTQTVNVGSGEIVSYNVPYVINVTIGDYSLVVDVNAGADSDQDNNVKHIDFTVVIPNPNIQIDTNGIVDYLPGDLIYVHGKVTQKVTNAPLANQRVVVRMVDSQGVVIPSTERSYTTDANGEYYVSVPVPSGKEGTHRLNVTVETIAGEFSDDKNINIVAQLAPENIPAWVYLLIVAIVIAVIVIFSLYLYRVGLGRMVECGNCGALIPEASRHCPKCGVEFESDTAKCSECGAWIPSKAESCPDCGAKFMTEPVETGQAPGYVEAMRKQYDEYIEAFRGQAKAALGSKYSEEKFMEWLKTEPNYMPFEEWLRKEEMSRRSGVFPCPACGTLNPRDSKICNRCGTVFEQQAASETPKAEVKKSPFRRIVRRSNEPKEAPKEQAPEAPDETPVEEPKPEESGEKPL